MRVYYSAIGDPEAFPVSKYYWFPYAEWLMRRKWGKAIVKAYLYIRLLGE